MCLHGRYCVDGVTGFFRLSQAHDNLANFYTLNFNLVQHHGWQLSDLYDMIPYERELNVLLLTTWLKAEKERRDREAQR